MVATGEVTTRRAPSQSHEECHYQLPQKFLHELHNLNLSYPGFQKDFEVAQDFFNRGSESSFLKSFRKLKEKQRVYDDYKAHTRLHALASLELAYPGHEFDKQKVEEWHLQHPSNDETDMIFQDKLEGLRNKEKLYLGDRSHPNLKDLDDLELSYPDWEKDYQAAITAHCDTPGRSFANHLHRLRQKQRVFEGDRSHWRLVELDKLNLTYPGWELDWKEVEEWHFNFADNPRNDQLYAEVMEGLKDQQQIYLGWDYDEEEEEDEGKEEEEEDTGDSDDDEEEEDANNEEDEQGDDEANTESPQSDESTNSVVSHVSTRAAVDRERAKMNEMVKFYASISENLCSMEGRKKKLVEERSTCSSNPASRSSSPERERSSSKHSSPTKSRRPATIDVAVPIFTVRAEEARPPKQVNLGKCEVCFIRPKTHVFVPCGHLCACAACSYKAMEETGTCPICREHSDNSFRVFLT